MSASTPKATEGTPPFTLLRSPKLWSNLFAGLITGLVSLTYSLSFAALIFSGTLASFFPQGVGIALISSLITGIIVAVRSSFPFATAGPDSNSAAILALMAATIATEIQASGQAERLFPTMFVAITLGTLLTGLSLFTLGQLRLGRWARFIPYTVMGGFIAGTGWLIVCSSFKVMAGIPLSLENLPALIQPNLMPYWLPGLGFAAVIMGVTHRVQHVLVLPGLIVGAIAISNVGITIANRAGIGDRQDWFLQSFPGNQLWHGWQISPALIDWDVLLNQSGTLMAMIVVVVIAILLNATGVELAAQQDSNLDKELRTNGIANLVTGCFGGMVGNFSMNRTLLNRNAGASSPVAGIIAAGLCGSVLLFGSGFLPYIPKFVLGGLLLSIGFKLLLEWVYSARSKFPASEYVLILIILISIAVWGFIEGVGVGLVVACALFAFNYSRLQVVRHAFSGGTHPSNVRRSPSEQRLLRQKGDQIYALLLQGYIFFGTANALLEQVKQQLTHSEPQVKFLVLDFRLVTGLDSSVVLSFIKMQQLAQKYQFQIVFTHLDLTIHHQLQQGGCIQADDSTIHLASDLDRGIEWCEDQILEASPMRRRRSLPLALQFNEVFSNPSHIPKFMTYLEQVQVPVGHLLFREGDSSDALYFIESGQITVFLQFETGQTRRIRTLNAGTIVGEIAFYLNTPHTTSASTDQPSKLYRLSNTSLARLQEEQPQIASTFQGFVIRLLADRLMYAYEEIEELL